MESCTRGASQAGGLFLRTGSAGLCLGLLFLGATASAGRAQVITEFSAGITAGATPQGITAGPDGNVWFTERNGDRIGRITPAGAVTEFSSGITSGAAPANIATGRDGNLWFTESSGNRVGLITPAGAVTEFSVPPPAGQPYSIAAGPDGNLWFTATTAVGGNPNGAIGRLTTAGVFSMFTTGISDTGPYWITAGPDGNLWFTEPLTNKIGRITTAGVVTEFSSGLTPFAHLAAITAGPDGALWFAETNVHAIGRVTIAGAITEFTAGISSSAFPVGIVTGLDDNLWFTEGNSIGRITLTGTVTEFSSGITPGASTTFITLGPDGNLWFSEDAIDSIGRITPGPSGTQFYALTPCRVIDTRGANGPYGAPALSAGATRTFVLAGQCGIPPAARSVAVNITVTQPTNPGFLTLFPGGTAKPLVSAINYKSGQTRANNAVEPLGASGDLSVFCGQAGGTVQFIFDVTGYFQ